MVIPTKTHRFDQDDDQDVAVDYADSLGVGVDHDQGVAVDEGVGLIEALEHVMDSGRRCGPGRSRGRSLSFGSMRIIVVEPDELPELQLMSSKKFAVHYPARGDREACCGQTSAGTQVSCRRLALVTCRRCIGVLESERMWRRHGRCVAPKNLRHGKVGTVA